jgi:hypothetical protein
MRKIIISGIGLLFSGALSCQLFHFYQPAANNSLTYSAWKEVFRIGVNSASDTLLPPQYSLGFSPDNTLFGVYMYKSLAVTYFKAFNIFPDDSFFWYGQTTSANFSNPILRFSPDVYPVYKHPMVAVNYGGAGIQIMTNQNTDAAWGFFSLLATNSTTNLFDYIPGSDPYANNFVALVRVNTNVLTYINKNGMDWNRLIDVSIGTFPLTSISMAISVHGHVYVCVANDEYIKIIYYNNKTFQQTILDVDKGSKAAKIFIDKNDILYLVYTGYFDNRYVLKMNTYQVDNDTSDLRFLNESKIYDENIFIYYADYNNALALESDRDGGLFYVGFIEPKYRQPVVLKNNGNIFYPVSGFPKDITNCAYIKLAVDSWGNAAAGVVRIDSTTNIIIYKMK